MLDQNENALELPEGTISVLKLKDRLYANLEAADLFITELEKKALDPVFMSMSMGASAERAATMDPSIEGSLYDVYESLSSACKDARDQMLTEIRKSYNS